MALRGEVGPGGGDTGLVQVPNPGALKIWVGTASRPHLPFPHNPTGWTDQGSDHHPSSRGRVPGKQPTSHFNRLELPGSRERPRGFNAVHIHPWTVGKVVRLPGSVLGKQGRQSACLETKIAASSQVWSKPWQRWRTSAQARLREWIADCDMACRPLLPGSVPIAPRESNSPGNCRGCSA